MVGLEMTPWEEAVVLVEARAVMEGTTHLVETAEMAIHAMGPFPGGRQPTMTDRRESVVSWATLVQLAAAAAEGQPSQEMKATTRAKAVLAVAGAAAAAGVPHIVPTAAEAPAQAATLVTPCGW